MTMLFGAILLADLELIHLTPAKQKEHQFAVTLTREPGSNDLLLECPARSHRGPLWEIRIQLRGKGHQDNLVIPEFQVSLRAFETTPDGRRVARFSVSGDFVKSAGILLRYGHPEVETIYSLDLADWIPAKK